MAKKTKRHGVKGRRWRRKNAPVRPERQRKRGLTEGVWGVKGKIAGWIVDDHYKVKSRHVYVLIHWFCKPTCRHCHGEPVPARADHLRCGRIVSCGKVKADNYKAWLARPWGVDAATGQSISKAYKKLKGKQ